MGDEIKVGNVFNLPVKVTPPVTETKGGWPIVSASLVGNSISGQIATLTISKGQHSGASKYLDVDLAFKMAQASALAINNHDRLVEENKRLREMLKRLKNECEMFYSEFGEPNDGNFEAAFVEVDDLLSELGGD
ncbi:TPA: hypothetical protein ACMDUN_002474 [Vibrio cholerae]